MVARVTITPELFVSSNMLQHIDIEYYNRASHSENGEKRVIFVGAMSVAITTLDRCKTQQPLDLPG